METMEGRVNTFLNEIEREVTRQDFENSWKKILNGSAALTFLAVVFGILGNGAVIWLIIFKMKRSHVNIWFLNLAISDFLILFFQSFQAVSYVLKYWPFGIPFCKLTLYVSTINICVSSFTLLGINIDRGISLTNPFWVQKHRPMNCSRICCFILWILFILAGIPIFFMCISPKTEPGIYESFCGLNINSNLKLFNEKCQEADNETQYRVMEMFHPPNLQEFNSTTSRIYTVYTTISVFSFILPLIMTIISNLMIFLSMKESLTKKSSRIYTILVSSVAVFFITMLPLYLNAMVYMASIYTLNSKLYGSTVLVMPLVASFKHMNSCISPILYFLVGKEAKGIIRESISLMKSSGAQSKSSE
ncbi:G-protein coupled receptor 1-like [Polypterus senegalus]|uniref:G-protein coupled receptor 1-like n=1 Tax=Polypterus senegalus TaxID=55291 RepID=UPI0019630577|nr:G-protein coupled receptor 1-like [Polypterus senegalus]